MRHLQLRTISKALAATVGGTLAALGTAMLDGDLTRPESITAAGLGLLAGFGTYAAPRNTERVMQPQRRPASRP